MDFLYCKNLNVEIKMRRSRAHLEATAILIESFLLPLDYSHDCLLNSRFRRLFLVPH